MLQYENLLTTLDRYNSAVFLKGLDGRYLSMNTKGLNYMKDHHVGVLGKTTYDLFDMNTASLMVENDHYMMRNSGVHTSHYEATSLAIGKPMSIFTAKTAVRAPSGKPLGTVAIALMDYKNAELFPEVCRLLPHFIKSKHSHLIHELLELQTIMEFSKLHRLH